MKLKRTGLKVLLSASIILSMIPFSFISVFADYTSTDYNNILFRTHNTIKVGSANASEICYYFVPRYQVKTGELRITVNPQFAITNSNFSWFMEESDGAVLLGYSTSTSGNNVPSYTFTIALNNCNYFKFVIRNTNPTFWTDAKLGSYSDYWGYISGNTSISLNYGDTYIPASNLYAMNRIYNAITTGGSGGGVSLTTIEDNQEIIITNQETIIDKMDSIIELLEVQTGSDSETSIDDNTQVNEDLQTESSTYQQLESQFNDDFNDNLENVPTQTLEDHLQTWSTGVTWFRTQMDNIYNNLGEFKYIASIAIVLAIALIFIGR